MAAFSIDEVRDTIAADITNFLGDIEDAARTVNALPGVSTQWTEPARDSALQAFRKLEDHGHAIAGTCGLVAATSLAEGGSLLQGLAIKGQAALVTLLQSAALVRRVSELCQGGAGTMRQLLELELQHDAGAAELLLGRWRDKIHDLEASTAPRADALGRTQRDSSFHFESEFPEPSGAEMALATFWSEFRASVPALAEHVRAAQDEPREQQHLADAAHILHALHGAAATVGLDAITRVFAGLQHDIDALLASETPTRERLLELGARLASLGQMGRVDSPSLDSPSLDSPSAAEVATVDEVGAKARDALAQARKEQRAPTTMTGGLHTRPTQRPTPGMEPVDSELTEIFREEVAQASSELLATVARLRRNPAAVRELEQLERTFHTLKGAALTVGLVEIARAAEALQQTCAVRSENPVVAEGSENSELNFVTELSQAVDQFLLSVGPPATSTESHEFAFDEHPTVAGVFHPSLAGAGVGAGVAVSKHTDTAAASCASNTEVSSAAARELINALEFSFADSQLDIGARTDLAAPSHMAQVFRSEANELAQLIAVDLVRLRTPDPERVSQKRCAHHLQRLGGSALTAGLLEVAELLEDLCGKATALADTSSPAAGTVDDLIQGVYRLFSELELPLRVTVDSTAPNSELVTEPARQVFLQEARELLNQVRRAQGDLAQAATERRGELYATLGKLFHRLKGSAALLDETRIAERAGALQDLSTNCKAPAELDAGIAELAAQLTLLAARPHSLTPENASQDVTSPGPLEKRGVAPSRAPETGARGEPSDFERSPVELPEQPELIEAFTLECGELLERLQRTAVALEQTAQPKQSLETALRVVHTLKGVVYTIGLAPTGQELHLVEDLLEQLIEGAALPQVADLVNLLLVTVEDVRRNLREARSGYVTSSLARAKQRIQVVLTGSARRGTRDKRASAGNAQANREGSRGRDASEVIFEDAPDRGYIRVATERLDELMNLAGELVVSRSRLVSRVDALRALQVHLGGSRRRLMDAVEAFRERYEFANTEEERAVSGGDTQVVVKGPWRRSGSGAEQLFGSLELDRYDDVNILSRKLNEIANDIDEVDSQVVLHLGGVGDDSESFASIVSGIQSEVTRARTVPLDVVFARLQLPVRDAAQRENKTVRFRTSGTDVAVDKTIADALFQPLLHLVRNAVAHGIESPERRRALGKPEAGQIVLYGRQEAGQIVLALEDDGAGLDLEALRAQGTALGIIEANTALDDPGVRDLVFVTGLSTRAGAGETSGRGVGCDVVRRSVERLNGDVRVETQRGVGTTFFIKLPLTLAIANTLLVRHRGQSFAIPLSFADRILEVQEAEVVASGENRRVKLDDQYLLIQSLDDLLALESQPTPAPESSQGPIVVLRVGEQRTALQVDAVVGQEEVVVKDLGDLLGGHPFFSGVTIRGAGGLTLILDAPAICEMRRPETLQKKSAFGPALARGLEAGVASAEHQTLRVLVVDDSLSVRKVAKRLLSVLGAHVELAIDGVDAMEKLRQESFDMVFTDLEMPQMHGYDLIRELRFLPRYAKLPIIVVSSRSQEKHRRHAHELGATDYVTKPFTAQVLRQMLDKYGGPVRASHVEP